MVFKMIFFSWTCISKTYTETSPSFFEFTDEQIQYFVLFSNLVLPNEIKMEGIWVCCGVYGHKTLEKSDDGIQFIAQAPNNEMESLQIKSQKGIQEVVDNYF